MHFLVLCNVAFTFNFFKKLFYLNTVCLKQDDVLRTKLNTAISRFPFSDRGSSVTRNRFLNTAKLIYSKFECHKNSL